MREIRPLTALRGLAALLVFMYHYAVLHAPDGGANVVLRSVWSHGYMGVPVFFVLSGFLITRLYFDPLRDGAVSVRTFLVKRIARIWPLFLVLATLQHLTLWRTGRLPWSADWLVTLSMSQGWFAELLYGGLPPAWSLTIEETFYVLAPPLCLVIDRLVFPGGRQAVLDAGRAWRLAAVLAAASLALAAAGALGWLTAAAAGLDWRGFLAGPDHVWRMTLAGRFPEFAVGVAAAFVHRDGRLLRRLGPRGAGLGAALLLAGMGGLLALKDGAAPGGQYAIHVAVAVATGLLILLLTVDGHAVARMMATGPAVGLGRVSYAFYLLQLSVLTDPLVALADRCGTWRLPVLFVQLAALSTLLYVVIERPARRAIIARWLTAGDAVGPATPRG
jgi:peptidoglycan/LPS O-acetylase OafA/YrhL